MSQSLECQNVVDADGVPAGGFVILAIKDPDEGKILASGELALWIRWQNGPLVVDGVRHEPNGAFVETVIEAVVQRIEHYQTTKFRCIENAEALGHLSAALEALRERTASRQARQVEGTSQP